MSILSLGRRSLFLNKLIRSYSIIFFISILSVKADAVFLTNTDETPGIGYYKLVFHRFYDWYNKNYFNFDQHLNSLEKNLLQAVIEDIDQTQALLDPKTEMPRLRWGLTLKGKDLFFGTLFISFREKDIKEQKLLSEWLKSQKMIKNTNLKNEYLYALQWDFSEKQVSVFYQVGEKPDLQQIVYKNKLKFKDISWVKINDEKNQAEPGFAAGISQIWNVAEAKYIVTATFPSKKYSELLRKPLRDIAQEFGFSPQAILLKNEDDLRIFYP